MCYNSDMENNEQVEKILNLYYTFTSLKEVNRTGWRYWCVEGMPIESIADHTYGAIMLALSIYANTDLKLDINKVVMMLALHETEEIYIGDLTPFDKKARLTKAEDGKKAVERVFACADKKKYFLDIIAEFLAFICFGLAVVAAVGATREWYLHIKDNKKDEHGTDK